MTGTTPPPTKRPLRERTKTRAAAAWRRARALTRVALLKVGEFCHTSPFAAVAPWVGTLVGSWIVGANTSSFSHIVLGAAIAAVGCAPVAAAAQWVKTKGNRTRRRDARERKILEYVSLVLVPKLGEFSHLSHADRVEARNAVLVSTVDYLDDIYREEDRLVRKPSLTTRVVLHAFKTSPDLLEVIHQAGRADAATTFNIHDARGQKVVAELLTGAVTYASKLAGRNYVSYVSAPIVTEAAIFGMISVDTTDVRQLDKEDAAALEVIASTLAIFYEESSTP